jgi:outer membrane immunogenic protein
MRVKIACALTALLCGSASAADLPVYTEPVPYIAPAAFSWTGFYVGVAGSYGISRSDAASSFTIDDGEEEEDVDVTIGDWWGGGAMIGAHAGYQYQFGLFVLGAELAAHFSGIDGEDRLTIDSVPFDAEAFLATDVNWLATARLKAGVAIDRGLIYAIGGLAFADVENSIGFNIATGGGSDGDSWSNADTKTGWTLGLGLEYAITDNWIFGVEYQHVELGDNTVTIDTDDLDIPVDFDNALDIVSAKLSYKF